MENTISAIFLQRSPLFLIFFKDLQYVAIGIRVIVSFMCIESNF